MHASPPARVTSTSKGSDRGPAERTIDWLVDVYLDDVYRYAFRLTGNQADAEDVVQQVFLQAQQHIDQLRDAGRVRGWLLRIVHNTHIKQFRRRRPRIASAVNVEIDTVPGHPPAEGPDRDAIQAAIDQLDDHHRQIVLMFFFEDLSYQQIAQRLNVKLGTVMSRLSRAKASLRAIIAKNTN
jgi:RNA polymerase sigma-70 factor (ECF subfamily)